MSGTKLAPGALLTPEQARDILAVGRSSVYRLCAAGVLPCIRIRVPGKRRGALRIPREALEAYVRGLLLERPTAVEPPTDPDEILRRVEGGT